MQTKSNNKKKITKKKYFFISLGLTRIHLGPTYFYSGWKIKDYAVII